MKTIYFDKRSLMTAYAQESGLEIVRCKLSCEHARITWNPAILLIDKKQTVQYRLVKCKMCKKEGV